MSSVPGLIQRFAVRFQENRSQVPMSTEYETGLLRRVTRSDPVGTHHRADLEVVSWFGSVGLILTVILCALGYAESIGRALAISG